MAFYFQGLRQNPGPCNLSRPCLGCEIKNSVRAGFKPLVQIGKHVNNLNASYPKVTEQCSKISKSKCSHLDFPGECVKVYREKGISFKPFTGKCSDSFVLLKDGSIGKILAIHCNDEK